MTAILGPGDAGDARLFAMAAGEIHGAMVRRGIRDAEFAGTGGDGPGRAVRNLSYLAASQAISPADEARLADMLAALSGDDGDGALRVTQLYHDAIDDPASSPAAVAILSIAVNSLSTARDSVVDNAGAIAASDVTGAIEGAFLGTEYFGFPYGTLAGAVTLGAASSIATALG